MKTEYVAGGILALVTGYYLLRGGGSLSGSSGGLGSDPGGNMVASVPGGGAASPSIGIDAPNPEYTPDNITLTKKEMKTDPTLFNADYGDNGIYTSQPTKYPTGNTGGFALLPFGSSMDYEPTSSKKVAGYFSPGNAPGTFFGSDPTGQKQSQADIYYARVAAANAPAVSKKAARTSGGSGVSIGNYSGQGGGNYTGRSPAGKAAPTIYGSIGFKNG